MLVSVCVSVPDTHACAWDLLQISIFFFVFFQRLTAREDLRPPPTVFELLLPFCVAGFQHLQGGHPRRSGGRRRRPGGRAGAGQEEELRRSAEERHPVREVPLVFPLGSFELGRR